MVVPPIWAMDGLCVLHIVATNLACFRARICIQFSISIHFHEKFQWRRKVLRLWTSQASLKDTLSYFVWISLLCVRNDNTSCPKDHVVIYLPEWWNICVKGDAREIVNNIRCYQFPWFFLKFVFECVETCLMIFGVATWVRTISDYCIKLHFRSSYRKCQLHRQQSK